MLQDHGAVGVDPAGGFSVEAHSRSYEATRTSLPNPRFSTVSPKETLPQSRAHAVCATGGHAKWADCTVLSWMRLASGAEAEDEECTLVYQNRAVP